MYNRLINLFGENNLIKLHNINVLLVGVGGVGSACFEALIRSGVQNITIIDHDIYEETNLNRQLHSNIKRIGFKKVDVLKEVGLSINPELNIEVFDEYLTDTSNIDLNKYDYIIDACDSIKAKIFLITTAQELGKKEISALGVGNRLSSNALEITTLSKTVNDPLGKKLRYELKKIGFNYKVNVVSSKEVPIKNGNIISSYIGVASSAGLLLADFVIKDVITNGSNKN